MTKFVNYFDTLYFTDCSFEKPEFTSSSISVIVYNLGITKNHPANKNSVELLMIPSCYLNFDGVTNSRREITDYLEDPKRPNHFIPRIDSQVNNDGPFSKTEKAVNEFFLEGVLDNPIRWVEWTINCESFSLEIPDTTVF